MVRPSCLLMLGVMRVMLLLPDRVVVACYDVETVVFVCVVCDVYDVVVAGYVIVAICGVDLYGVVVVV